MVQKISIAHPATGVEEQAAITAVNKYGMLAQGPAVSHNCAVTNGIAQKHD